MRAPSQRRALGVLFGFLALALAGVAWAAALASQWVVAVAAAVIGLWLASLMVSAFRAARRPG
ncbi:MAG TPA: hypothetical protein VFU10_13000 [Gaiellaceae bacterium]|nr:hypothetical protein [Gaiellaceae bacterium]